jgi:hypothetical protein
MSFDSTVAAMTVEQARWVRSMRVDEGRTWRWIAEEWSEAHSPDEVEWDFASGRWICETAAGRLGENAALPPWR